MTGDRHLIKHLFLILSCICIVPLVHAQDKFPAPLGLPNELFYLQRTTNTNTLIYELNYENGELNSEEPVHVYWLRYAEGGEKEELNYIQRKFAYGIKADKLADGKYALHFVSYKKFPMYLMKNADGQYNVYVSINKKQAMLERIFVKINGGSLWSPKIEYVELKGIEPGTGRVVTERLKI